MKNRKEFSRILKTWLLIKVVFNFFRLAKQSAKMYSHLVTAREFTIPCSKVIQNLANSKRGILQEKCEDKVHAVLVAYKKEKFKSVTCTYMSMVCCILRKKT